MGISAGLRGLLSFELCNLHLYPLAFMKTQTLELLPYIGGDSYWDLEGTSPHGYAMLQVATDKYVILFLSLCLSEISFFRRTIASALCAHQQLQCWESHMVFRPKLPFRESYSQPSRPYRLHWLMLPQFGRTILRLSDDELSVFRQADQQPL
jgi:hypothetical protein